MDNLLIDIGNSDIKIGEGNPLNGKVRLINRFSYSKKNFKKDFDNGFKPANAFSYVRSGISLLNDKDKKYLKEHLKNITGGTPFFIDREMKLPVKIEYSKGIGNDRICNAVAVYKIFGLKNILVIDFGTATTYTMVSKGILKGGLISPGIKTSLYCLTYKTSLPEVKLNYPKALINNNTIDNIQAGVLFQALFSVERIITEISKKYKDTIVVATGGNAEIISKKTKLINEVDRSLVLKGINFIISQ